MTTLLAEPVAAPVVLAEPDAPPLFAVYPRRVAIEGSGSAMVLAVVAESDAASRAFEATRFMGVGACTDLMRTARNEFFATGPGKDLLDKEEKFREAERAVADATASVAQLRDRWRSAVATADVKDMTDLEKQIESQERILARLSVRVPVLGDEVAKARTAAGAELNRTLARVRDEFRRDAAVRLAAVRDRMTEAVNGVYLDWFRCQCEFDGGQVDGETVRRLGRVD